MKTDNIETLFWIIIGVECVAIIAIIIAYFSMKPTNILTTKKQNEVDNSIEQELSKNKKTK